MRKWVIVFTVVLSTMIELLDTTIVNVSLPHMMGNLGATLDEIAWVVTAYVFANVIVVPMASWLAIVFGRRNYFVGSIVLFTVSSFFCGNASTLWELVLFRFMQGVGGGALMATSQSILIETFPPAELGVATGLFGLGVVVGPMIGPTLGGWITENYSWPWIFYINLTIGTFAAIMSLLFIRDPHEKRVVEGVDWLGILLLIAGVGSLQIVLDRGERDDWFAAPHINVLSITAVIGIAAFAWWELKTHRPVVDLRVLKIRSLALGVFFTFTHGFITMTSQFIVPVFIQNILRLSPLQAGVLVLPSSLASATMMPWAGYLIRRRFPPKLMMIIGFSLFFVSSLMLSHLSLDAGESDFFWPMLLRGFGLGMLFVPFTTLALAGLSQRDTHQATGLTNMMRQLGGSTGVALMATFIQQRNWAHRQNLLTHLTPYDPALRERLAAIVHGFVAQGSTLIEARRRALAAIDAVMSRQALLLTYLDAFRIVGVMFLFCIPLILLFRRPRSPVTVPAAH